MKWEDFSGLVSLLKGRERGLPSGRSCRAKPALSGKEQGVSVGDSYRFTSAFYRGDAWQATVELRDFLSRDRDPRW